MRASHACMAARVRMDTTSGAVIERKVLGRWPWRLVPRQRPSTDAGHLSGGAASVLARSELAHMPEWAGMFAGRHLDHRYYELVEDTIEPAFSYRYFVVRDPSGKCAAVQPFFVTDADLLTAAGASW